MDMLAYILIPMVGLFSIIVPAIVVNRLFDICWSGDDATPVESILGVIALAGILLALTLQT